MSFLAPQAYTKETLAKAFDWLQHQPAHITQAATTPDNLVAIFLKAQRQGITTIDHDAPVSSRRFIDDLKTLRKEMAPFDEEPRHQEPRQQEQRRENITVNVAVAANHNAASTENLVREVARPAAPSVEMDARSMELVAQIQERFNLSSPQEAVRMLIAVGSQHIGRWP